MVLSSGFIGCAGGEQAVRSDRAARYDHPSCLAVREGCPPEKEVPACAGVAGAVPLAELLAGGEKWVDQEIAVRGPIGRGDGVCTLLGCMGGGCCNKCGASFALGTEAALAEKDYARRRASTVMLSGEGLGCGGDESIVCCPFAAKGQEVVARGTLRRHGMTWILEKATICAPPGALEPAN